MDQGVGRQHDAREVGGAQQGSAHLFEHDDELDVAVALAAVLLRNRERLKAHLFGHLSPDSLVVALLGGHLLAYGRLGRLVFEEAVDEFSELFLLFGEGEVHGGSPNPA